MTVVARGRDACGHPQALHFSGSVYANGIGRAGWLPLRSNKVDHYHVTLDAIKRVCIAVGARLDCLMILVNRLKCVCLLAFVVKMGATTTENNARQLNSLSVGAESRARFRTMALRVHPKQISLLTI